MGAEGSASPTLEWIMDDQEPDVIGAFVSSFLLFAGSVAILITMVREAVT
jgi:hypothetical protein